MNIEATAYHEAGHAVAYFAFGLPFNRVTIVPDIAKGTDGFVSAPRSADPRWLDIEGDEEDEEMGEDEKNTLIEKQISIDYIAGLAEEKYTGIYDIHGASRDRESALVFASVRCGSNEEGEAYLNWLFIRSRNFVNNPVRWLQIQAVANALLERQELSQDEAIEIMRKAVMR